MTKLAYLNTPALEVLVDIARTIGARGYSSGGDSRSDWRDMCQWADKFQAEFEANSMACETYIEDVEQFATSMAIEAGWTTQ